MSALIHGQDFPVAAAAMAAVAVVLILGPPDSSLVLRTALAAGAAIVVVCLGYGLIGLLGSRTPRSTNSPATNEPCSASLRWMASPCTPTPSGAIGVRHHRGAGRRAGKPSAGHPASACSGRGGGVVEPEPHRDRLRPGRVLVLLLVNRWPGARDRLAGLVVLIPLIPVVAAWAVVPARALTGVVNGRDLAWIPALEAFIRSPVTGYGPEVLSRAYWRTQPNQWWEPLHAHNQALQTLAESGLIGAAALVALILTAVVATFARSGTMASLLVALLGFLAFQSTVEVPLGLTYFPISYLLPALCLAVFAYTGDLGGHPPRPGAIGSRRPARPVR